MSTPGPTPTMLLVEPDAQIADDLLGPARQRGIRAQWCRDGGDALVQAGATQPDVLVIAAALPTLSSSQVIQIVKDKWKMGILVGAAPGDDDATRHALAAGATAVIARPYDLEAIVTVGLGMSSWGLPADSTEPGSEILVAGPITVDLGRHEARLHGRELHFSHRELQLLIYLIRRAGRVANQTEITAAVWGHPVDTNTVAVHIKRLRDKLGHDPQHGQMIRTVRGAGYRLAPSLCPAPRSHAS